MVVVAVVVPQCSCYVCSGTSTKSGSTPSSINTSPSRDSPDSPSPIIIMVVLRLWGSLASTPPTSSILVVSMMISIVATS